MKRPEVLDLQEPKIQKEEILIVRDKYFHPGNIAIVTGAASGIGRATAIALGSLKCANYGGAPIYEEDLKAAVRKL